MIMIGAKIALPLSEVDFVGIRASGPGGQNVNKVSSAVHLRFDIKKSSLPLQYQQRLMDLRDRRISKDGVIVIKAERHRSQEKNRAEALQRLQMLLRSATHSLKPRKATQPSRSSKQKRMDRKAQHGKKKALRLKPTIE